MDKRVGNRFWEARSSHGRSPIFRSPDDLYDAACEYFKWVDDNPILEYELVKFQGDAKLDFVPKQRPMTIDGLCLFLDISRQTFYDYEKREDFIDIVSRIKTIIYDNKYVGAATNQFNANIIARDLGLRDAQDVDQKVSGNLQHDHEHKHEHEFSNAVLDALKKKHGE